MNLNTFALTYDDIQLIPKYSNIKSRQDIKLHTKISRRYGLLLPYIASPMDTVCELDMAFKMFLMGGAGVIHRFMSIEEQVKIVKLLRNKIYGEGFGGPFEYWGIMYDNWHTEIAQIPIVAAIGVQEEDKLRAKELILAGANILLIDVAHGHHQNVIDMIRWCKENLKDSVDIIAGNIATAQAAQDLIDAGADGLRVGIGGGALCSTRIQTGFGIPNVTCIEEISKVSSVPIIADGGIRTSGDIAKALGIGASSVMMGSILAGTDEAPGMIIQTKGGLYKRYRGSASKETKAAHKQELRNIEGESTTVPYKGGVKFIIKELTDGLKSALSYAGADCLDNYFPQYVIVTNAGITEAKPHLI